MITRPRLTALAAAAATAALLSGCTTPPPAPVPTTPAASGAKLATSLTALFKQTLERDKATLSPFEKDVLTRAVATGRIPAGDYQAAVDKRAACMRDAGYTEASTMLANGLYKVTPTVPSSGDIKKWADAYAAKDKSCSTGTTMVVESLYTVQQGNPDLLSDSYQIAVGCLVRAGLVPATYTAKQLEDWVATHEGNPPFKLSDARAQVCLANGGIAVAGQG